MFPQSRAKEQFDALDSMDRTPTQWEIDFLESVAKRFKAEQPLTWPQLKTLQAMYDKYFDE